jgi:hypothetical protein
MTDYPRIQQELLDRFIDALDYARQDERIAEVVVPQLAVDLAPGKRFGELSRSDVEQLAQQASKVGQRRADVIRGMWLDMQRKKTPPRPPSATVLRLDRSRGATGHRN